MDKSSENPVKKKRGRKPKNYVENENNSTNNNSSVDNDTTVNVPKKRGRKPKGGKLINKINNTNEKQVEINNVILHLKCYLSDLNNTTFSLSNNISYNPEAPPNIEYFSDNTNINYSSYENTQDNLDNNNNNDNQTDINIIDDNDSKTLEQKLKIIKMQLYKNQICDKKSACFWCTYDFDNTTCYIPMYDNTDSVIGYGSFCRPECAAAYLLKENIDDSLKFERYHLLNKYYAKIYNYNKSIKPSPDPFYTLDKFFGNLSIKDYRKLLKSDHMLVTLNKPFTKSLPELHEENDGMVSDIYGCGNPNKQSLGTYKVKRQSEKQKGPTKSTIIAEKFGIK
jgi:hypothetical protein